MDVDRYTGNSIKKALERRQTTGLPSNFSFRMMEQVRIEAQKMERRRKRITVFSLGIAVVVLIALVVYCLFFYLGFSIVDFMPHWKPSGASSSLLGFYTYIALLSLGLLGVDYWIRKKKKSTYNK